MTTTDRMDNLDSRREITDRTGQTVILGNSVGSAALDAPAQIVCGAAGESRATSEIDMDAAASVEFQNASFGIWSVFLDIDNFANLASNGAAIASARGIQAMTALLTMVADASLLNIQVKTSTGVYTPTTGTAKVFVWCLGGGGGGGGTSNTTAGNNSFSGGGGSSSLAMGIITSGFSGVTVTIGAGGTAGIVGGGPGGNGGATSFGSFVISGGGVGGGGHAGTAVSGAVPGGSPGASSGTASLFGSQGVYGSDGVAALAGGASGGYGGHTIFGGVRSTAGQQINGIGFGGGGSGAQSNGGGAGRVGGTGAPGLCIIFEFSA